MSRESPVAALYRRLLRDVRQTMRAPSDQPAAHARTVRTTTMCPHCGGPVEHRAAYCPACGTALDEATAGDTDAEFPRAGSECRACGAVLAGDPETRALRCLFCAAPELVPLPERDEPRVVPDHVVPFRVSRAGAAETLRAWSHSGLFAPDQLRTLGNRGAVRPVFLPFWSCSLEATTEWLVEIGEYRDVRRSETVEDAHGRSRERTRTERQTEWHPFAGMHAGLHRHQLVAAFRGLPKREVDAVAPFDLMAMQRARPSLLDGAPVEPPSLAREDASDIGRTLIEEREREAIAALLPGDTYADLRTTTEVDDVQIELVLLPFWLATLSYRGREYHFVMNGQTGQAVGTRPQSVVRIALAIALAVLVLEVVLVIVLRFPSG